MAQQFRWKTQTVAPTDLYAVRGYGTGPIFASGVTFLRSDDLGLTWSPQPIKIAKNYSILGICRGSGDRWHVVGAGGDVALSADNGTTWTKQKSGTEIALTAVHADREGIVMAVGGGVDSLFLRSEDDGAHWKRTLHKARGDEFQGLHAIWGEGKELIAVAAGLVMRSSDAGRTWKPSPSPDESMLIGVTGRRNERYACGPHGLFRSTDRGARWSAVKGKFDKLTRLWCSPSGWLWACGRGGTVCRSEDGLEWTALKTGCKADLNSIWAEDDVVIAVGAKGTVLRGQA